MTRYVFKNRKRKYVRLKAFEKCPQRSGTCLKVFYDAPKKPNSSLRKLVKAKLSNLRNVRAHIPGEGHKLMKFSYVLFRGCRVRDMPGIKYRVIRNAYGYSLKCVMHRVKGRSKYGTKRVYKYIQKYSFGQTGRLPKKKKR